MSTLEEVLAEYALLPKKQGDDYLKKVLANARSSPINIDDRETDAIALLTNLAAKLSPSPPDCRNSAGLALKDKKFLTAATAGIQGLISHSIKFSDAKYSGGVLAYAPLNYNNQVRYVSSVTTRLIKPFDWCGNSKDLSVKILFCTAFAWRDRVLTLAEAIAERIPVFTQALIDLSLSEEQVEQIAQRSKLALQPRVPDGKSYKMLYFPRRSSGKANDYFLVTPVPSVAMHREIQRRTQKDALPESTTIRVRRHQVGETKPLNVGDFYGSVSGYVTVLNGGFFDAQKPRSERALAWFLAGNLYWGRLPKPKPDKNDGARNGKEQTRSNPFFFLPQLTGSLYPKAHEYQQMRGGFSYLLTNYLLAPHLEWAGLADSGELTRPTGKKTPLHYFVFGQDNDDDDKQSAANAVVKDVIRRNCIETIAKKVVNIAHRNGVHLAKAHMEALYEAIEDVIALRFGETR